MDILMGWIAADEFLPKLRLNTVADLKMESGRVYRAVWCRRGRVTAWWPKSSARKSLIGAADPIEFRMVAAGMGDK
jgi:hypothetical protein